LIKVAQILVAGSAETDFTRISVAAAFSEISSSGFFRRPLVEPKKAASAFGDNVRPALSPARQSESSRYLIKRRLYGYGFIRRKSRNRSKLIAADSCVPGVGCASGVA